MATSATNARVAGQGGRMVRWNGKAWKPVHVPGGINWLYAMAATSASNAWAVGYDSAGVLTHPALILHWNGKTWRKSA